jgi:ribosomal protein S1
MESLLAQHAAIAQKLSAKTVVWVKVIQVTVDQVFVDIGEKREGIIPLSEFEDGSVLSKPKIPSVGQRVPVMRVGTQRDGTAILSHRKAKAEICWQGLKKTFEEKARVRGRVQMAIKGGFLVDLGGVMGFLPASLADLRFVRSPERLVGMGVRCTILELHESKRQAVISRKAVLEEESAKRRAKILSALKVGEIRIGRIIHVSSAGLIVDIGGLEGFVRASDAAWGTLPPAPFQRGDKVKVKVLTKPDSLTQGSGGTPGVAPSGVPSESGKALRSVSPQVPPREGGRVGLGIKQLTPNPADAVQKKYPLKSVVRGKVIEAGPSGVRIAVEDKTTALSPASECDPQTPYKSGDPVAAVVEGVNANTFELVVSISKYEAIRDRKRMAQYLKAPKPLTLGELLSPEKGE